MIAVATTSRRSVAAREQWSEPRHRARILCGQILASERRRVDRLVESNLHLLPLAAGYFHKKFPSVPRDDLAQAAWFGLRRAAELFDATKGAQFHTYAFMWLRDSINREFFLMGSIIRVPKLATSATPRIASLDAQHDGDGSTFGALIEDDNAETPADAAHRSELRTRIVEALATLRPRDALVIAMRFGIGEHRTSTGDEIRSRLGVSRSRASQLERRALGKLKEALAAFGE